MLKRVLASFVAKLFFVNNKTKTCSSRVSYKAHFSKCSRSVCLPVSLYCWLSPFMPQPDDKRGFELTTDAVHEPLSNPSIEKGTAAADWSWWPANSYTWWWLRWYGKPTIPPREPPNWAWGGSSILLSIISQAKGNDVWWSVMWI